ncbi:hypothetical protein [Streptomyces sp. NPDC020996]|uniref:hypothetical protein n=1 Tax=Streptomyces sp. NPDC020996 TaxID=3154791 RepID=UPI0033C76587
MVGREVAAADHPSKEVREVLKRLVADGWMLRSEGHWGTLYCPCEEHCTAIRVGGTPKNPGQEARRVQRRAKLCPLPPDDPRAALHGGNAK